MGKRKISKKIKKQIQKILVLIVIAVIIALLEKTGILVKLEPYLEKMGLLNNTNNEWVETSTLVKENVSEKIIIDNEKLNILFLNVGQADCELIINKGKTMLIDAGNVQDGKKIVEGIKALGITNLDYVIGTHVHEDHVGGMSYIINEFEVGNFYLPYNTNTTNTYYKYLLEALKNKNVSIKKASVEDKFNLEDAYIKIMSVDNNQPEDANDSSIVLQMQYGTLKYLFMGDATTQNESSRDWEDIDLIKVGHHGSLTSNSEKFLNQVRPEIAIICAGKDNSYGLPKDKVLERYKKIGSKIYRTDIDGTIQIISDGNTNEVSKIDISFDENN